jgi:signal peptidase I
MIRVLQLAHQVINLGLIVTSALMIWKSLMVVTNSESPVVVVLSGSMEPAFQRGDILFCAWLSTVVEILSPSTVLELFACLTNREICV